MVPEALGRVYLICLCLDVYVSVLVLPCLTGLLPPPSRPTTVCLSFLALPLLSGSPSPILSFPPPHASPKGEAELLELQTRRSASQMSAGCS